MRRKRKRKTLPVVDARRSGDEGRCEQRRRRTEIVEAEWRNRVHDSGRQPGKCCVEETIACTNAALSAATQDLFPDAPFGRGRIGNADSWSEIPVTDRGKRPGNARI